MAILEAHSTYDYSLEFTLIEPGFAHVYLTVDSLKAKQRLLKFAKLHNAPLVYC